MIWSQTIRVGGVFRTLRYDRLSATSDQFTRVVLDLSQVGLFFAEANNAWVVSKSATGCWSTRVTDFADVRGVFSADFASDAGWSRTYRFRTGSGSNRRPLCSCA